MPVLTLEALEADPWNAVEYELPEEAERGLLDAAFRAVRGCLKREHDLMLAAEAEWRIKPETGEAEYPPNHAEHKARWEQGCERLYLIADRYQHELRVYNEAHPTDWDRRMQQLQNLMASYQQQLSAEPPEDEAGDLTDADTEEDQPPLTPDPPPSG
jgi:hypothetical protein